MVKLRWFDTGALDPYENMAVDEALFLEKLPAIRFYSWNETSYSIGYFQSMHDCDFDHPLVRRFTGGGTVLHGEDLTYSIVLNLNTFSFLDSIKQSYFWIHRGILEALRGLGIPIEIFSDHKYENGQFCFQSPFPGDLVLGKFKVAGGAQRRRGGFLLHQGSIQLNQLPIERPVLIKAILEGLARTFKLDLHEGFDILSKIKDTVEVLKSKYQSKEWINRF